MTLTATESLGALKAAVAAADRGEQESALQGYAAAIEGLRAAGNLDKLAAALFGRGTLLGQRGELKLAIESLLEARDDFARTASLDWVEHTNSELVSLATMCGATLEAGIAKQLSGDIEQALTLVTRAADGFRAGGHRKELGAAQMARGNLLCDAREFNLGLECLREARSLCEETGDRPGIELTRTVANSAAGSLMNDAIELIKREGGLTEDEVVGVLHMLRYAERALRTGAESDEGGDHENSAIQVRDALLGSVTRQSGAAKVATVLSQLGYALQSEDGDLGGALLAHTESQQKAGEAGSREGVCIALANRALILERYNQIEGALQCAHQAQQAAHEIGRIDVSERMAALVNSLTS